VQRFFFVAVAVGAFFVIALSAHGFDINNKLSVGGVLAGVYQYQQVSDPAGRNDAGRGAIAFQPEMSFKATENDKIFVKFGFAAGNGLNEKSPFVLAPFAADLEDDVKDINGRDRDYLLSAWYTHTFRLSDTSILGVTGGLIDATDYLDDNAFSGDEYTQFMNEALINAPNAFFPSYDIGAALEWNAGDFSLRGVGMKIGSNDDGNSFTFYGFQLGYNLKSSLGEGNYRMIVGLTSRDFLDPQGEQKESRRCIIFSFDQGIGELLGLWLRFGSQKDDAAINFENIYSGGIDISGKLWGREKDNIGLGYAYLNGGNLEIDDNQVVESYVRFALNDYLSITLDVQYMRENLNDGSDSKGYIYGIRFVAGL
jgi:hypothetical protein